MIASLIDARKRFVRLIVAARQSGVMLWVVANAAGVSDFLCNCVLVHAS